MNTTSFEVDAVSGAERRIVAALGPVAGVSEVHPDAATNRVVVRFDDSTIDVNSIARRLNSAGFPVRAVHSDSAADEPLAGAPSPGAQATAPDPAAPAPWRPPASTPSAASGSGVAAPPAPASTAPGAGRGSPAGAGGDRPRPPADPSSYGMLVAGVVLLALAGLAVFWFYPGTDLPEVGGGALTGLAAWAGVAAFFAPGSLPLLLALLGRRGGAGSGPSPVVAAGALTLGGAGLLLLVGMIMAGTGPEAFTAMHAASPVGVVLRAMVGAVFVVLGMSHVGVLPLRGSVLAPDGSAVASFAALGFGYVLVGLGWTGPMLAALTTASAGMGFVAFFVTAAVYSALLLGVGFVLTRAEQGLVERIGVSSSELRVWGGWLLVAAGAALFVLALFA